MNTDPIGFLDSGLGGLSVWQAVHALMPDESTVYIGDQQCAPYGDKPGEFIIRRVISLINVLRQKQVKLIVIACNTATVAGINVYRAANPDIPIIGVVPVVKKASETTSTGTFAVLSTPFTSRSAYQKELIEKFAKGKRVYVLEAPDFVACIENGTYDTPAFRDRLKSVLAPVTGDSADVLVLGCTHFPFIRSLIRDIIGPDRLIMDSGGAVARQTRRILEKERLITQNRHPTYAFFTTGNAVTVTSAIRKLIPDRIQFSGIRVPDIP